MRAAGRAQDVVGVVHVACHPVAEGLVDGVLQDAGAVGHRHHRGAQALHPEDVRPLALHVHLAHVDGAGKPNLAAMVAVATPCWPAPVSAMTRVLPMRLDQQPLAHDVVGLVRAGVVQVLALDIDARPAEMAAQVLGEGEGRGPARVGGHQLLVLPPERGIGLGRGEGRSSSSKVATRISGRNAPPNPS
jgi:hypothetical protein